MGTDPTQLRTMVYASPLGPLHLLGDGRSLRGLWLEGQKGFPAALLAGTPEGETAALNACARWLDRYFAGDDPGEPEFSLDPQGTAFQQRVWQRLGQIPYGKTVSYGQLSRELHTSARAVGGAVGKNPVLILIPCHRVLGADGSLTGFAAGLEAKKTLLNIEKNTT